MKLILIDGGPAAGKNTLGKLLVEKFFDLGEKAILLDLDTYVEKYNPKWIWEKDDQKQTDQKNARVDFSKDINRYLKENDVVLVIGERFLTTEDVHNFISKISAVCAVYLYHLSVPFELREKRLRDRGPHSLINLAKDQKDRDTVKEWPGYVYQNINFPEKDAINLMKLIQDAQGLINL